MEIKMQKLSIFALLPIALATAPAGAQPANSTHSIVVEHNDLDLRIEKNVRKLERRIWRAAQKLCGEAPAYDLEAMNAVRQCRRDTRQMGDAQAVPIIASAQQRSRAIRVTARQK